MKMIVALGNPGDQYNFTRHNFGFLVADFWAKLRGWKWNSKPKFGAIYGRCGDVLVIKPQGFYNDSGIAVRAFADYYKIPTSEILVVCDDFELPFGALRYRAKGSSGGNNGLKSIAERLGTDEFPRLRLGTGNEELRRRMGDVDFVLGRFTAEEKEQLPEILKEAVEKIEGL